MTTYSLSLIDHPLISTIRTLVKDSRAIGILLIGCTLISLVLSNIEATQTYYIHFWQQEIHLPFSALHLPETNLLWVNDMLMTFFFFLVGMEIKKELLVGELSSVKKSLMPILAALGGMVCPAIIFSILNAKTPFYHGWGIPMATDIAFSLGILSLLGKKVPVQLKIFLAALAIIDDLGAVVTIAVFYSYKLHLAYLVGGLVAVATAFILNKLKVRNVWLYAIPGIVLWYCLFNSGIHATIAGVLMSFIMPLPQLAKLEVKLFYPVNFFIMPLFALANTAIVFPSSFNEVYTSTISFGVMLGLILGKPIGIFLFSFIASKLKIATLPTNTSYKQLWGVGMIGGIGFTMSIFTSSLAYHDEALQVISKVAILSASLIAGVAGYYYLHRLHINKLATVPAQQINLNDENEEDLFLPSSAIA